MKKANSRGKSRSTEKKQVLRAPLAGVVQQASKKVLSEPRRKVESVRAHSKTNESALTVRKSKPMAPPQEKLVKIGKVTHYFPKVRAAVLMLERSLTVGTMCHFKGNQTDFRQAVESMQINRVPIRLAKKGQEIGLEVIAEVHPGDIVYGVKE